MALPNLSSKARLYGIIGLIVVVLVVLGLVISHKHSQKPASLGTNNNSSSKKAPLKKAVTTAPATTNTNGQ